MQARITGTVKELTQLWSWEKVCELINVDYYKLSMVPDTETFTITETDLKRVGIIEGD